MKPAFFTEAQTAQILDCIREAEKRTSGELRLHVESRCWRDPFARACLVFNKLGMEKTEQRNAILIYLSVKSRKFAIVGDQGINDKVDAGYWTVIRDRMQAAFAAGELYEGICSAIEEIGKTLRKHFPVLEDDRNELSDEISYSD